MFTRSCEDGKKKDLPGSAVSRVTRRKKVHMEIEGIAREVVDCKYGVHTDFQEAHQRDCQQSSRLRVFAPSRAPGSAGGCR